MLTILAIYATEQRWASLGGLQKYRAAELPSYKGETLHGVRFLRIQAPLSVPKHGNKVAEVGYRV